MEGGTRKRKMANEEEEEEEDNEEEKMEKFFALIKSTREVRDFLIRSNSNNGNGSKEKQEKKKVDDDRKPKATTGVWNPTFQPEDFLGGIHRNHNDHNINIPGGAVALAGPCRKALGEEENNKEEDRGGNDLDLNFSL